MIQIVLDFYIIQTDLSYIYFIFMVIELIYHNLKKLLRKYEPILKVM